MTKDEALTIALEALEEAWYHVGTFQPTEKAIDLYDEARTAIKEALAQPDYRAVKTYHEGKPVYVAQQEQNLSCKSTQARLATAWGYVKAQPEQESFEYWNAVEGWVKIDEVREHFDSVGCGTIYKTAGEDRTPLYTSPTQSKPLMDEVIWLEYQKIWPFHPAEEPTLAKAIIDFARAIEAAHGIKE